MKLVLVESPTKARTLTRFLKDKYQIEASMGHIRDLPKSKLGVDVEDKFEPHYVVPSSKKKVVGKLRKISKDADEIILATDLDREGEAIAYHLRYLLKNGKAGKNNKKEFKRITFHEITKEAIEKALKAPGKINMELVDSQQARRVLDRLVGYKLSPLLWKKVRTGLSAGRVQTPAVRLIVDKEREIEAFDPEEYWKIYAILAPKKDKEFTGLLIKKDEETLKIKNEKQAKKHCDILDKSKYRVKDVRKKKITISPRPPFITSSLQRVASIYYHWTSKKTMHFAQRLYEKGLITYHRTDSYNLNKKAVVSCRKYIKDKYGDKYVPEKPRFYKTKSKLAQEAHEAIRVTDMTITPEKLKLKGAEKKLYELIFKRFVGCQMSDRIVERTTIDVEAKDNGNAFLFRTKGRIEKFPGWRKVYGNKKEEKDELPEVKKDEKLDLKKLDPQQKFTSPPPRYTESTLIKELEDKGIGRPSTYASIISTIQNRRYVEKEEGRFKPTPVGTTVTDFLLKYFPKIFAYQFTAKMEDDLDKVAEGKENWTELMEDFYEPFEKNLEKALEKAERQKIEAEKIGKKCPKCEKGEQVIRVGKYGKFLSCSRFPDCKWTAAYVEKLEDFECPECGGDVVIKRTRKGKKFYGCSNYPKCEWASWKNPKKK